MIATAHCDESTALSDCLHVDSSCLDWRSRTRPAEPTRSESSLYADVCARCHGSDGRESSKTPVADLTSPAVQLRMDAQLFQAIHDGKSNTAMGAWKYALSDEEIRDVLSFVRTLELLRDDRKALVPFCRTAVGGYYPRTWLVVRDGMDHIPDRPERNWHPRPFRDPSPYRPARSCRNFPSASNSSMISPATW